MADLTITGTKADIGLGNVDNTSDANKPVSTAQATAIGAKQDALVSGTNIKTINSSSILGTGDLVVGSDLKLVGSATASTSATIEFTGLGSTYQAYMVVISNLIPVTDATALCMRCSTDNGSTFISTANIYRHARTAMPSSGVLFTGASNGDTQMLIAGNQGNNTGESLSCIVKLMNPSSAAYLKVTIEGCYLGADAIFYSLFGGGVIGTGVINAVQFYMSSGNIASGEFRLYGIKNA